MKLKAQTIIKKTPRGYIVSVDNGYGQTIDLTDFVETLEEAENMALEFLNNGFTMVLTPKHSN